MQHLLSRRFDLGDWLQAVSGWRHFVGPAIGRACREAIEQQLSETMHGTVTTIDCSGVDHMDFTAADEYFCKLILRVQALEYGDIYVVMAGLTPTHEENLVVALERKKLAALVQRKDGSEIIGHLNPYIRDVFAFLREQKVGTARDWAEATGDDISLGSTKMLHLYKARLVQRVYNRLKAGGGQYVYRVVEGMLEDRR